jgi:hypothetical protein
MVWSIASSKMLWTALRGSFFGNGDTRRLHCGEAQLEVAQRFSSFEIF